MISANAPEARHRTAGITKRIASIQRMAVLKITGAMRMSLMDAIKIHVGLLPMELQMSKVCHVPGSATKNAPSAQAAIGGDLEQRSISLLTAPQTCSPIQPGPN